MSSEHMPLPSHPTSTYKPLESGEDSQATTHSRTACPEQERWKVETPSRRAHWDPAKRLDPKTEQAAKAKPQSDTTQKRTQRETGQTNREGEGWEARY